ncbi:MAG: long-chain-fatty-acid--CoA ligase [Acidobacteriota bacterium]|nr:long-chain-fatty-acid--CoA ligase [Blastocatellia bacterium]MDW8240954.1 long-chain-fatty-acid--CoA ligase [Acidobacteriota bacterium]
MKETIPDLLRLRAQTTPDKTFLYFHDLEVSYGQLHELTNRVARGLLELGVNKGDKVCVMLTNRPEFVYLFLATPKLGAVLVPINVLLKAEEVQYIVNNSDATTMVTESKFLPLIEAIRPVCPQLKQIVVVGDDAPAGMLSFTELLAAPPDELDVPISPDDEMGIIYTSGTTGKPKGVVLTQGNYYINSWQGAMVSGMNADERAMCILPLFHVNGQVVTILMPMQGGGSMILTEGFSPKTFFENLARYRATTFSGVPTVYSILLNLPDADQYDLSSLRMCICGAAPMPVEVFTRFEEKFHAKIIEGYGLSEGTCASTINPVEGKRKIGSIGLPFPGQELAIVDDNGQPLPAGQVGEIIIRGRNVMKGYYKNPEATAQTIRNGWLYTGDLGYYDEEGYFYIVGRKKEMIIRGGVNIYPQEIEQVLYQHPKVKEAAVIGLPDPIWGEEVGACLILKEGETWDAADVIAYCQSRLADFKCPRRVFFVDSFPRTATGKIQKHLLSESVLKS